MQSNHPVLTKYRRLLCLIRDYDSVIVAYSGGVDSTLLAFLARGVLGKRAMAITACSETYPAYEREDAVNFARELGLAHRLINTDELVSESFASNPPERCYFCKQELFKKLRSIADKEKVKHLLDGTNLSDAGDFRPGEKAGREYGVRRPLAEVGLSKKEVRLISGLLGLPTWDKPAQACLASRFPYGTRITKEKLDQIAQAEDFLRSLGFRIIRVRHHNKMARIELALKEIPLLLRPEISRPVVTKFQQLGYDYVTVDLEGYRSGSMNTRIWNEQKNLSNAVEVMDEPVANVYLACPRCNEQLTEVVSSDSRGKQCPHCGGIWFHLNELEKALGNDVRFVVPADAAVEIGAASTKSACPVCQAEMVRIKALNVSDVEVWACVICQGRWLNGTEVAKLQNRGFFIQIKNFVMRLFSF